MVTGREPWVSEFLNPTQIWDAIPDWPDGDPSEFYSAPRTGERVAAEVGSIDWEGTRKSLRTGPTDRLGERAEALGITHNPGYQAFVEQGEAWWV